jgi:hypothetical protein
VDGAAEPLDLAGLGGTALGGPGEPDREEPLGAAFPAPAADHNSTSRP